MDWPWRQTTDLDAEVERVVSRMTPREDPAQLRRMVRRGYRKQSDGSYLRFPRREDEKSGVRANWSIDIDVTLRSVRCPLAFALAGADGIQRFRNHDVQRRRKLIESLAGHDRPIGCRVFDCGHDIPGYEPSALASFIGQWVSGLGE